MSSSQDRMKKADAEQVIADAREKQRQADQAAQLEALRQQRLARARATLRGE